MSNYYLSKCCNAHIQPFTTTFQNGYICDECRNDCDIYPVIDKN